MTSHILARFNRSTLEAAQAEAISEAVRDTADTTPTRADREDPTIGNERLLRGIPVAGVGGGAIARTRPEWEAMRLDGLRRRRA